MDRDFYETAEFCWTRGSIRLAAPCRPHAALLAFDSRRIRCVRGSFVRTFPRYSERIVWQQDWV